MQGPMEMIPVLIIRMQISRWVWGGVSRNGINGRPLVSMMILNPHLRNIIKMVPMVSIMVFLIFLRLFFNAFI